MKRLFLLRHGDTHPYHSKGDKYRCLSEKGEKEIKKLRKKYPEIFTQIDLVICSSATRTRHTLQCLEKGLRDRITICYYDSLYLASAATLLEEINLINHHFSTILIVGHNNGLSDFAKQICDQQGLAFVPFHTGEMAEFFVKAEEWGKVRMVDLQLNCLYSFQEKS